MKVETSVELLLPSVQYGSIRLLNKISLDTVTDLGRIEEEHKRLGLKGDKLSTTTVIEITRKLALNEIIQQKQDVDEGMKMEDFELKLFAKKK